jgi:hypothetical protein
MLYKPSFVKAAHVITATRDITSLSTDKKITLIGYRGKNPITLVVSVKDFTEQDFLHAFWEIHDCIRVGNPDETWIMEVVDRYHEYRFILPEHISGRFTVNGVKVE